MNGFFELTEIKKFSLEEKIIWILDKIITSFSINKTKQKTIRYWNYVTDKYQTYSVIYSNIPLNLEKINELKIPFDGIIVKNYKEFIYISGKDFEYTFKIDMILTMKNRFNKIKPKIK